MFCIDDLDPSRSRNHAHGPERGDWMTTRIVSVVGARPNFIKMAPVVEALNGLRDVEQLVVHTGQHYDQKMSADILADLGFPAPDVCTSASAQAHTASRPAARSSHSSRW